MGFRFLKRVDMRGTITLPVDIRKAMGVAEGDIVEFEAVSVVRKSASTRSLTSDGSPQ